MAENQTSFKPGQSGNPNGRPKREWTWAGLLEEAMEEQDETGESYKKIIVRKARTLGIKGDMTAIKEIMNRMDGMPKQAMDMDMSGNVIIDIGDIIGLKDGRHKPEGDSTVPTEAKDSTTDPVQS